MVISQGMAKMYAHALKAQWMWMWDEEREGERVSIRPSA